MKTTDPKDARGLLHQRIPRGIDPVLFVLIGLALLLCAPVLLLVIISAAILKGLVVCSSALTGSSSCFTSRLQSLHSLLTTKSSELLTLDIGKRCCVCGLPAVQTIETYYQKQRHFCNQHKLK